MNIAKLVTFAFASKRRRLATLTIVGLTGIGALVGGGDTTPAKAPVVVATDTPAPAPAPAPAADLTPVTAAGYVDTGKCDGVHFNLAVAAGDKRDRDGDGIACEKN